MTLQCQKIPHFKKKIPNGDANIQALSIAPYVLKKTERDCAD
jgi:hypothetical protein